MEQVSRQLADHVARTRSADLPDEVLHAARRSLLNGFATALAGARDPAIDIAWNVQRRFAGPGGCALIGRAECADMLSAACINAAAMNVHDFDDTHLRTVIHPTAPVAPALLALAATREIGGRDFLAALALGIETACRIGNAVSPGHYARGWHITATCGVFGAAGRILVLDPDRMLNALGAASAQASGLVETLGFMAKSIGVGAACRGGLMAAMLAEEGLDGPPMPLEGPRGFLTVTGDGPDLAEVSGELGSRWEVLRNIHKPYPCGIVLNAVIDACLELRARPGFRADAVRGVTLHGNPLLAQRADRPGIATGRESQVSAQHAVAAALIRGRAGLEDFSDAAVDDPAIAAF
ncbi:MAG: MmgE/PrpD family protein, partial [Rhodospirillales bacterium]